MTSTSLADGSVVYAGEGDDRRIYRAVDGVATPIAGLQFADPFQPVLCDGSPATQSYLGHIQDVAARPDGRVLVGLAQFFGSESQGARICEITADGRLVKVAGAATNACPAGVNDCRGDGDPAVDAPIGRPDHLVRRQTARCTSSSTEAPTNGHHGLIRKIDTAGVISTVAGGGNGHVDPTLGLPADDFFVSSVTGLAELPTGALLLADGNQAILEVGTDGDGPAVGGEVEHRQPGPLRVRRGSQGRAVPRPHRPRRRSRGRGLCARAPARTGTAWSASARTGSSYG